MKYARFARYLLHHPLIVIPVLLLLLGTGWQQYAQAGRNLNLPRHGLNLFATIDPAQLPASGLPTGWEVVRGGEIDYTTERIGGYATAEATKITTTSYKSGDVSLVSPKVSVEPNQTYLFKGYYTANASFALIAHYFYADDTDRLVYLDTYPAQNDKWSTTSHALDTSNRITGVQFIYRLTSNSSLSVDEMYLEPKQDIFIASQLPSAENTVPNSALHTKNVDMPDDWTTYQTGNNTAAFDLLYDERGAYIKTTVKDFGSGEAKWQYVPQPVKADQNYRFTASYMSDRPAQLVAEYVLENGKRQFDAIATIMPASQWTEVSYSMQVPPDAKSLAVSMVLGGNGSLASREYTLANITKPGASRWNRPLVSISFDDGWRSVHANAAPRLETHGYRGTFYINPSSIETPGFMSASELANLRDAGHEIGAHGYSHKDMTTLNTDALNYQLLHGRDYLTNAGFSATHFAAPYGKSDAEVEWLTRKYFTTSRGLDAGVNTKQNFDPYNLRALYIKHDTKQETIDEALREARAANGWLILVYHGVGPTLERNAPPTVTLDQFTHQVGQVQKSGMVVVPVGIAYTEVAQQ